MAKFEGKKLAIIGGGHIGLALAEGFINSGKIVSSQLIVANPSLSKIAHLKKHGVEITTDNKIAAAKADWIFLAVRPFVVDRVLLEISDSVKGKLIISLTAVVTIDKLRSRVKNTKVIRIMPNMSISCNQGVIGLYAKELTGQDKKYIRELLNCLGLVIEVKKQKDLDVLTLLSGCGPAIVSQFIEIMANYGMNIGLSSYKSHALALQTFKGTALLLEKSGLSSEELILSVATKGGITEAILNNLRQAGFQENFIQAMEIGYGKIKELDQKLNKEVVLLKKRKKYEVQ